MLKRKLQQMKQGQYFLTIPSQIVRLKQWNKQDEILFEIDVKGNIVLRKWAVGNLGISWIYYQI